MRILYFGTYDAGVGRNKVYISGLKKLGHTIIECRDQSSGLKKYYRLWQKHRQVKDSYDAFIVGCPGHAVVWFARLISQKPVIFDAGWTMEEAVITSRKKYGFLNLNYFYIKFIDWLAVKAAHRVLVETEAQRKFFEEKFRQHRKYNVLYTGADDEDFYADNSVQKNSTFTAVFRGKFLPEAGVLHLIKAAKILEKEQIKFIVMGSGWLEKEIEQTIHDLRPTNLTLIKEFVSFEFLRKTMLSSHVSVGQLENHPRLEHTIPHKCFETIAISIPYLTARTAPVAEILQDGDSVLFCNPGDADDLAKKILKIKNNPELALEIGKNGYEIYKKAFTPIALAKNLLEII